MVQVHSEEELKCRQDDENFKQNPSKEWFLYDDEVASLLLDMRDRISKPLSLQVEPKKEEVICESSTPSELPSKKRKYPGDSEDECEGIEEPPEDDDEWMEGRNDYFSQTLISQTSIRKKAPSGSACEKHKRWKKRCPDDCPMRKAKRKDGPNTNYYEMIQWSLIELKEDYSDLEEEREEEMEEEEDEEEEEFQAKKRRIQETEPTEKKEKRKQRRNKSSKGRTGRKYLPQACERHKILHAKCPANCPDRLRRDAEVARQQRLQPLGSSSSSEDLLA